MNFNFNEFDIGADPVSSRSNWEVLISSCMYYLRNTNNQQSGRTGRSGQGNWYTPAGVLVADQAIELAGRVRDYYLAELTMQRLRGIALSQFRQTLYAFLMDQLRVTSNEAGMIYQLPYFYVYDQSLLEIAQTTTNVVEPHVMPQHQMTLRPLVRLARSNKSNKAISYWWINQAGQAVFMEVKCEWPGMISIMDSLWHTDACVYQAELKAESIRVNRAHWVWRLVKPQLVSLTPSAIT